MFENCASSIGLFEKIGITIFFLLEEKKKEVSDSCFSSSDKLITVASDKQEGTLIKGCRPEVDPWSCLHIMFGVNGCKRHMSHLVNSNRLFMSALFSNSILEI